MFAGHQISVAWFTRSRNEGSRILAQQLLKEIEADGSSLRKAHRLKRRTYHNMMGTIS